MKIIEIKDFRGEVIFRHKSENNTLRETVELAVKRGVNLLDTGLSGAYLIGTYFSN